PPAVQAYIAARTDGPDRTNALAALASSFGLGTIIGPAIAPLFIFAPLGLSAPLFAFATIGVIVLALLVLKLPDDTPRNEAKGQIIAYPSIGGAGATPAPDENIPASLSWRDRRVLPWHLIGIIGGHGHAIMLGVVGFLVIDRLSLTLDQAQQWIAIVLMSGAAASLFAQWWLIPRLNLDPRQLVLWGSLVAAIGSAGTGLAQGVYGLTLGFAIASMGFGLFRPGFTSGASLAVGPDEQNEVAGQVTSVNGVAFVAGPAGGVALYMLSLALPFLVTAGLMLALALWTWLRFSPLAPEGSASPAG
ncbi:MAG: MFS transporter, partial [Allosphingosinicella sp.]